MRKIFCFINGSSPNWHEVAALSEDGYFLTSHISSSEMWAKHDIGITSDWKHDVYKKHYPDGYELVWIENPRESKELDSAYENFKKLEGKGDLPDDQRAGVKITWD